MAVAVAVVMGGIASPAPAAVAAAVAVAVVAAAGVAVAAAAGLVVEAAAAAVGAVSAVAEVAPAAAAAAAAGIENKVVVDSQGLDVVAPAADVLAFPTPLTLGLAVPFPNVFSQAPFPAAPFAAREASF